MKEKLRLVMIATIELDPWIIEGTEIKAETFTEEDIVAIKERLKADQETAGDSFTMDKNVPLLPTYPECKGEPVEGERPIAKGEYDDTLYYETYHPIIVKRVEFYTAISRKAT